MTKMGVSRSLTAGLAVFFTVAILFSFRTALAADKPLQFGFLELQAFTIVIDLEKLDRFQGGFIEAQDKDYPYVIE